MPIIKEADFRKEIKTAPALGYLFFGEEDYLKSFAVKTARDAICSDPTFSFFNEMKLDAIDFTPQKLLDALMPLPMMADKKLVVVNGLNFNKMKPFELEELCEVLGELQSYDYNVLIINVSADCLDAGRIPKSPSKLLKTLGAYLTAVQFERITPSRLAAWVQKHFLHNGIEASPQFCARMIEYCGGSMFTLANEIDKLSYYLLAHDQKTATEEALVRVCIAAVEYDAFTFANAIMEKRQTVALEILSDYRQRRVEPVMILGDVIHVIYEMTCIRALAAEGRTTSEISEFLKIHEYKVGLYQKSLRNTTSERLRRALDACLEADASVKLSQGYTALEKLICTL